VAGSFVLIYAQPLSRVAAMTVEQITTSETGVSIRFATQPITVPDPPAGFIAELVVTGRSHHTRIGSINPTGWPYPCHLPGRPVTALRLGQRLGRFGIDARAARLAAQTQLAAQVPAVVLAEMLGVSIRTASTGSTPPAATGPTTPPQPPPTTKTDQFSNHQHIQHSTPQDQAFNTVGISGLHQLDAGVPLRDVQIAARHSDPRTTTRYDRARHNLGCHASYIVTAFIGGAS
jgi:hypothetical protein